MALVVSLLGLLLGWWWLSIAAGLVGGLLTSRGGAAFLPSFTGTLLAWAVLDLWRMMPAQGGAGLLWQVTAIAGLPSAAGAAFMALPAIIAAVASGLFAVAAATLRAAVERPRTDAPDVSA
ncbi:MAG: hypothetical protein ACM3ZA_01860 [Bacillota bacterium]